MKRVIKRTFANKKTILEAEFVDKQLYALNDLSKRVNKLERMKKERKKEEEKMSFGDKLFFGSYFMGAAIAMANMDDFSDEKSVLLGCGIFLASPVAVPVYLIYKGTEWVGLDLKLKKKD